MVKAAYKKKLKDAERRGDEAAAAQVWLTNYALILKLDLLFLC